jgi:hypothetical protein
MLDALKQWQNTRSVYAVTRENFDKRGSDDVHVSSSKTTNKQGISIHST